MFIDIEAPQTFTNQRRYQRLPEQQRRLKI